MTVLVLKNQLFYAFMIPLSGLVLGFFGVTWASMKVKAYKKMHTFELPE
jgi:hypothetical protein